jgi:hypothetical protein
MNKMDFIFKKFSTVCKILLALIAVVIFIRIIPWIVVAGVALFTFVKLRKYLKNRKINKPKNKRMNGFTRRKKHPFGISQEKIVDVDYDEVKK